LSLAAGDDFVPVALRSRVTGVQPMTGLVFWNDSANTGSDACQLEFSYVGYDEVCSKQGRYDWSEVEDRLKGAAKRRHQAILRFYDTYPGKPSAVPKWIKSSPGYKNVNAVSHDESTGFADWTHAGWRAFVLEFYAQFARKYDRDPRLAFLEVGFGLWAEYHVYDPGEQVGKNFPDKSFQVKFFDLMNEGFKATRWLISKDAYVETRSPFQEQLALLDIPFGIFDDTFTRAWSESYNMEGWQFFGRDRWQVAPMGGEQLIDSTDQAKEIVQNWARQANAFHVSFMIAEQWPNWMSGKLLRECSSSLGYRFQVRTFETSPAASRVTIANTGVAPIYYDAYPAVNGVRSKESLRGLLPNQARDFIIPSGASRAKFSIECDRLSPGQRIEFDAELRGR